MVAAYHDHLSVLQYLLNKGADINATEHIGDTALTLAAQEGSVQCVKELLRQGADQHHKNEKGLTAYDRASQNSHEHIVRILEEKTVEEVEIHFPVTNFRLFESQPALEKIEVEFKKFYPEQFCQRNLKRLLELGDLSYEGKLSS